MSAIITLSLYTVVTYSILVFSLFYTLLLLEDKVNDRGTRTGTGQSSKLKTVYVSLMKKVENIAISLFILVIYCSVYLLSFWLLDYSLASNAFQEVLEVYTILENISKQVIFVLVKNIVVFYEIASSLTIEVVKIHESIVYQSKLELESISNAGFILWILSFLSIPYTILVVAAIRDKFGFFSYGSIFILKYSYLCYFFVVIVIGIGNFVEVGSVILDKVLESIVGTVECQPQNTTPMYEGESSRIGAQRITVPTHPRVQSLSEVMASLEEDSSLFYLTDTDETDQLSTQTMVETGNFRNSLPDARVNRGSVILYSHTVNGPSQLGFTNIPDNGLGSSILQESIPSEVRSALSDESSDSDRTIREPFRTNVFTTPSQEPVRDPEISPTQTTFRRLSAVSAHTVRFAEDTIDTGSMITRRSTTVSEIAREELYYRFICTRDQLGGYALRTFLHPSQMNNFHMWTVLDITTPREIMEYGSSMFGHVQERATLSQRLHDLYYEFIHRTPTRNLEVTPAQHVYNMFFERSHTYFGTLFTHALIPSYVPVAAYLGFSTYCVIRRIMHSLPSAVHYFFTGDILSLRGVHRRLHVRYTNEVARRVAQLDPFRNRLAIMDRPIHTLPMQSQISRHIIVGSLWIINIYGFYTGLPRVRNLLRFLLFSFSNSYLAVQTLALDALPIGRTMVTDHAVFLFTSALLGTQWAVTTLYDALPSFPTFTFPFTIIGTIGTRPNLITMPSFVYSVFEFFLTPNNIFITYGEYITYFG